MKSTNSMMINITTQNYVPGTNKYRYVFTQPLNFKGTDAKLSVYQYSIYNSTYNISEKLGNNKYSIIWINGVTYNYIIPDGYYSFDDLNTNLQYNMATDKLYLQSTTDSSKVLYYLKFSANVILYKSQIDINYVPSSLPSGYIIPTGASWTLPTVAKFPQVNLSSGLMKIFGFTSISLYPSSQTTATTPKNVSFLSNTCPILSPTFSYLITCNLVESKVSNIANLCFQIPLTSSYGKLISNTTTGSSWLSIIKTTFNYIEITLLDNDYNVIIPNDPELTLSLIIQYENEN